MPRSTALAIPLIALGVFAGGATASAAIAAPATRAQAATHSVQPAGMTWHSLKLTFGWKSSAPLGTGSPAWTIRGGVVYLSGSIYRLHRTRVIENFARLPKVARPHGNMFFPIYTDDDTFGLLVVEANGGMWVNSPDPPTAREFSSLAGVSFPVASTARHRVHLRNGWTNFRAYGSGPLSYSVRGGTVYLTGDLRQKVGHKTVAAVLPPAARPAHLEYLSIAGNSIDGSLAIWPDGTMEIFGLAIRQDASLAGVSYPAAGTSATPLSLVDGWQSDQGGLGTGDPSYRVAHGAVYLSGSLDQPAAGNDEFAVLPPGARPAHDLYLKVYTDTDTVGTLLILPDGILQAYGPDPSNPRAFTSLAGISFALGS